MAYRLVEDLFWTDAYISELPTDGKCLYDYCIHNPQQKPHGVFCASIGLIAFHTGIQRERAIELLRQFDRDGKIKWVEKEQKIWTKQFILHQTHNPNWHTAILKSLEHEPLELRKEYIDYYKELGFWIKYKVKQEDLDNLSMNHSR